MRQLKYSELLRKNRELATALSGAPAYRAAILSNTTVALLKDVLEYVLRAEGINAQVELGDYDAIVQDSAKFKDRRLVAVYWELGNLVDGLHRRAESMSQAELDALADKTLSELDLVLRNLSGTALVLMNRFTARPFNQNAGGLAALAARLNAELEAMAPKNVRLVDVDALLGEVGVAASTDFRYYDSSKALYTLDFYKAWAERVLPLCLAAEGLARKALIFDCDNTLWKGILGEDGPDGIRVDGVFAEVQGQALALQKRGVILGICSKNAPEQVDAVLKSHPAMILRPEAFAASKVGWGEKDAALRDIAAELNIGLDSLVFVDDSSFEVELVRARLPQVRTFQVPERLEDYPALMRRVASLFPAEASTAEDAAKTRLYREQRERASQRPSFASTEDYLASLKQRVVVHENDAALTPRMAQLTQKTNQFNVTTKRYTEAEIGRLASAADATLLAFSVADRFGDNGVVGLCIAKLKGAEAEIDTFLMSCRVIGRNVEYAALDHLIAGLKRRGVARVRARHEKTAKNEPTVNFFESAGFTLVKTDGPSREYELDASAYRPHGPNYIEVVAK